MKTLYSQYCSEHSTNLVSTLHNNFSKFYTIFGKMCTAKPVLSGHSKRRPKIGFQDRLWLNAGQKLLQNESILQYFRPALSYHLSLRPLFCLFLSGRLRQVLTVDDSAGQLLKQYSGCLISPATSVKQRSNPV